MHHVSDLLNEADPAVSFLSRLQLKIEGHYVGWTLH